VFLLLSVGGKSRVKCGHVYEPLVILALQKLLVSYFKKVYIVEKIRPTLGLIWSKILWHPQLL